MSKAQDEEDERIGLSALTLTTVADGELDLDFQEKLGQVLSLIDDGGSFVPNSDGELVFKIPMEVEIRTGGGSFIVGARCLQVKEPKREQVQRVAYRRGDVLKSRPEPRQLDIEEEAGKVSPLRDVSNGEGDTDAI